MALSWVLQTLLFALAFANNELSTAQVLKAKVTCLDCQKHYDFSGIKLLVKCDKVKKLAMATTKEDGSFEAKLPSPRPLKCFVRLLGGQKQLYASSRVMASAIVKAEDATTYTTSTPLGFSTSCPLNIKEAACKAMNKLGSSKTVNLPVPPEWGLAPSSDYVPVMPIIGIP